MKVTLWSFHFVALLQISKQHSSDLTVSTTTGLLRGIIVPTTVGRARAFVGVPFAEPALGKVRFKKPLPKQPWKGIFDATSYPPMCPQPALEFNNYYVVKQTDPKSEDCLFLNVFTPIENSTRLTPVVVYIHGGFYFYGGVSMKLHDASELAAREDLVTVTIAYRLGALGFLNMDVEDAPGNMGLYDQLLALRWIRSNAKAFGGDPDKITIMGQSAGSFSVGVHLTSPKSKGLFRRAVMQSGSPFSSTMISEKEEAITRAHVLAKTLGCDSKTIRVTSLQATIECLRSKDVAAILNATARITVEGFDGFFPAVGDEMIPRDPVVALRDGNLNSRNLLVGISAAEGDGMLHFMTKRFHGGNSLEGVSKRTMMFIARGMMITMFGVDSAAVIEHYFGGSRGRDGTDAFHAAADLMGDNQLACPTIRFARMFLGPRRTVFMYQFSQQPSRIGWPKWVRPTHADEIAFVLGSVFKLERGVSKSDAQASENFMHIIATFSRTGVPQTGGKSRWPKFDGQKRYMDIGTRGNHPRKFLRQAACDLWEKVNHGESG